VAEQTHISWADATFNPWVGCMKVSPACDGCYAEHLMDTRMGRVTFGGPGNGVGTRERTSAANCASARSTDMKMRRRIARCRRP
jgi:protein gp37